MADLREVLGLFMPDEGPPLAGSENTRTFTVRMDVQVFARLEAMASYAEVSRNFLAVQLLELGMARVIAELPDEIRDEIEGDYLSKLQGED